MTAYRRLWSAVAISETGDWLLFIALPLYVLRVSDSALDTSGVFLAELVPAVVVGTACGPLIDRWRLAPLLRALTTGQALVLLPLAWVGPGRVWIVYAVAGVQAAITSITAPAQQAMVPSLVTPSQLARANSLVQMASNTARLVGSPLGGLLLPLLGLRALVFADMASFAAAAVLLGGMRAGAPSSPTIRRRGPARRLGAIGEGWDAARSSGVLMSALVISALAAIAQGLFLVLFVLFVLRSMHAGDQVVGLLRGVQAIGGVLGGVLVGTWARRFGARALTVWGLGAFGLISLVTWNSPAITTAAWWYAGLFIVVGIPSSALVTGLLTGAQLASPRFVVGRVLSLMQVAGALGQGAGILAAGVLSTSVSLTMLLDIQASLYLACALVAISGFAAVSPGLGAG